MARKGWGSISPGYRERLERGGITEQSYESGASLSEARGHPSRSQLIDQAVRHNHRIFSDTPNYSTRETKDFLSLLSNAQLREYRKLSGNEIMTRGRGQAPKSTHGMTKPEFLRWAKSTGFAPAGYWYHGW